jgi:uncharacterized protein YbaP (TraB family)
MRVRLTTLLVALVIVCSAPQAQNRDKHFIWAVRHADGVPTHLVGSLHVLTQEHYPLPAIFEQAFSASRVLIEEVDLDELTNPGAALPVFSKAMFTDGRTLDQVISPTTFEQIAKRATKAGLPVVAIQRMKPWMAALTLIVPALKESGFNPELGVDRHFFEKAKAAGIERRGLETVAYQLDRFDQMPLEIQEEMLRAVLADVDTQLANVKAIATAWAQGDTGTIERLLLGAFLESPQLYERLLAERNRNWVPLVEACLLKNTPCFVVVGAAHLVGPHSLVALLEKKGYNVEQQ